jgi:hypothetical protein
VSHLCPPVCRAGHLIRDGQGNFRRGLNQVRCRKGNFLHGFKFVVMEKGISITEKGLSVTRKVKSATEKVKSVVEKVKSVTNLIMSMTNGRRRFANKVKSVTELAGNKGFIPVS